MEFNAKDIMARRTKAISRYEDLENNIDLYDVEKELYMFRYSEDGKIASYNLPFSKLLELAKECEKERYIGDLLGPGGSIINPGDDGEGIINYLACLSDNVITALPNDIIEYAKNMEGQQL